MAGLGKVRWKAVQGWKERPAELLHCTFREKIDLILGFGRIDERSAPAR